eukprot:jgi/Mesen1/766/ME000110S_11032
MGLASLGHTSVDGPVMKSVCRLTNLTHLDMGGTYALGTVPLCFGDMVNLVYLDYNSNRIGGSLPDVMDFGGSAMTGVIPKCFGSLTQLVFLQLSTNHIGPLMFCAGGGWAFSAVGALEASLAIAKGAAPVAASEQQVLDCLPGGSGGSTCLGGWAGDALDYVANFTALSHAGLASAKDYPYAGARSKGGCNTALAKKGKVGMRMWEQTSFYGLFGLLLALQAQPVAVNVEASQKSFKSYKKGVYSDPGCYKTGLVDHTLLAVGYSLATPTPFLLLRNSWGTSWGEGGYMRLAIAGGPGICGVAATPGTYPVLPEKVCRTFLQNPCGAGACVDDLNGAFTCICPLGYAAPQAAGNKTVTYVVQAKDTCYRIYSTFRLTLAQFAKLNPKLNCKLALKAKTVVNVTPVPANAGCALLYALDQVAGDTWHDCAFQRRHGDTCASVQAQFKLKAAVLASINPGLDCQSLLEGQQVCVKAAASAAALALPEPATCALYKPVLTKDTCRTLIVRHKLTTEKFYQLNPGIYCKNLIPQSGFNLPGQQSSKVKAGDTCESILYYLFQKSAALFKKQNGGLVCDTWSLYVNQVLCLP